MCPRPFLSFPTASDKAKLSLATWLQTDVLWSISYKNSLARRNDGGLTCVLMEPWSSSWSRLRSGGSIWTVEDRSNVFLSIASMATCFRGEREEKEDDRKGWEGEGVSSLWGAEEHTVMVSLLASNTTESNSYMGEKLSQTNHVCDKKVHHPVIHTRD